MKILLQSAATLLLLANSALAQTEIQESIATVEARPWEAVLGFELSADRAETDRAYSYLASILPTYRFHPSWKASVSSEAEITTQADAQDFHWNDTVFSLANDGLALGDAATFEFRAMGLLPTARDERAAGLRASPGLGTTVEFTPTGDWKLSYDLEGFRLFRNGTKAAYRADSEDPESLPAADGFDKWSLSQEAGVAYQVYRDLWLSGSASHSLNGKWFGGRETVIEFQQAVTYNWDRWSFGLGHRSETTVREANGEKRKIAFARPEESQFFGSLAITL